MAAIDLLLEWSQTSERMHQVVLARLLGNTGLLSCLGIPGNPTDVSIETRNRLYDFTVSFDTGQTVCAELKVNSSLTKGQIERQIKGLEVSNNPPDILVYFLLGTSRFSWNRTKILDIATKLAPAVQPASILLIDTAQMQRSLHLVLLELLKNDDRDLSVAYLTALQNLGQLTKSYKTKPLLDWGRYDWFGFYDAINNEPNKTGMQFDGVMDYVPNPSGGFVGFWWHFIDIPRITDAQAYLQLEQTKLCFKGNVESAQLRTQIRDRLSEVVLEASEDLRQKGQVNLNVRRPQRFGNGYSMTVAEVTGDYRSNPNAARATVLGWNHCINVLTQTQQILDDAIQRY